VVAAPELGEMLPGPERDQVMTLDEFESVAVNDWGRPPAFTVIAGGFTLMLADPEELSSVHPTPSARRVVARPFASWVSLLPCMVFSFCLRADEVTDSIHYCTR
jgi:hypothetical protein